MFTRLIHMHLFPCHKWEIDVKNEHQNIGICVGFQNASLLTSVYTDLRVTECTFQFVLKKQKSDGDCASSLFSSCHIEEQILLSVSQLSSDRQTVCFRCRRVATALQSCQHHAPPPANVFPKPAEQICLLNLNRQFCKLKGALSYFCI